MTKVLLNVDGDNNIFFECIQHAGDHDVCTITSALCNYLCTVADCYCGVNARTYTEGHVQLDIEGANEGVVASFMGAMEAFNALQSLAPGAIKVY